MTAAELRRLARALRGVARSLEVVAECPVPRDLDCGVCHATTAGARRALFRIARTLPRRERSDVGKVVGGP